MVNDTTSDLFVTPPSGVLDAQEQKLREAYAQAMAQYTIAQAAATRAAAVADDGKAYSRHEVPGLGVYVIPRRTGWQFLLDIIHDPVPNIDFSANIYPAFDGVIGQHFNNTRLLDPLDDHYEAYESLRDNIAAVRNFLMARYFAVDSTVTSPEARKNLDEIAAFIGDGFYNNHYFGGIIPNHDPNKPHIDLSRAKEKGGAGAQYIYECVLAHERHSSGFRPLDAIIEFFGGKKAPNWKLPDAGKTHFTAMFHHDLPATQADGNNLNTATAAIAAAGASVNAIQARLDAVRDAKALTNSAGDLDHIGNYLVFTATHMDGVAHLDEPVRRKAVDLAKDILKKLKISIGDLNVMGGLQLKPSEDMAVLGSIKGVAKVYERLLAWARNNGDSAIFQHPSVLAATQAIAQMGYLAKQEALRMATLAGDAVMANNISEQMKRLPESFRPRPGTKFGNLLDTIQSGMETILNRTQQVVVDGGQIGHSLNGDRGGVSTVPTAGMGGQVSVNNAAGRNEQAMIAADLAANVEAQRVNAQLAAQSRKSGAQSQTQAQSAPQRNSSGRQALGTAKAAKQQAATVSSSRVSTTAPLTTAQQQAALRANTVAGLNAQRMQHDHHEEEEHAAQLRLEAQRRLAANAKAQATAAKIDPAMLKGFNMNGVTGPVVTAGRVPKPNEILASRTKGTQASAAPQTAKTPAVEANDRDRDLPPAPQPVPPTRGGGRSY